MAGNHGSRARLAWPAVWAPRAGSTVRRASFLRRHRPTRHRGGGRGQNSDRTAPPRAAGRSCDGPPPAETARPAPRPAPAALIPTACPAPGPGRDGPSGPKS
jgi:hypothetical protein